MDTLSVAPLQPVFRKRQAHQKNAAFGRDGFDHTGSWTLDSAFTGVATATWPMPTQVAATVAVRLAGKIVGFDRQMLVTPADKIATPLA